MSAKETNFFDIVIVLMICLSLEAIVETVCECIIEASK